MEFGQIEQVINIGSLKNKEVSNPSLFLSLAVVLILLAAIGWGIGYFYGQITFNQPSPNLEKKASTTKTSGDGSKVFTNNTYNFNLTYPENWTLTEKEEAVPVILLESKNASLEVTLIADQPVTFDKENKEAIEKTNEVNIKISGKEVKMMENLYKVGSYLSFATLKAKDGKPQVSFLLKASDTTSYEQGKKIVESFTFN